MFRTISGLKLRTLADCSPNLCLTIVPFDSERQQLVQRYDNWQKMRQVAAKNAGGKLPTTISEQAEFPPPPPPPVDESDFPDPSLELSQAALEADALDFSGVGMQGAGFTGHSEGPVLGLGQDAYQNQYGGAAAAPQAEPTVPHVRRKSALPGM